MEDSLHESDSNSEMEESDYEESPKKKEKQSKASKVTKKSSKKADKAKAEEAAKARADDAKVKFKGILPSANNLFGQSKYAEALQKYHDALSDHALPIGCVDARVLNKVLKCLVELTSCTQDVQALETLLACVQHCIYFVNRDCIGGCNIISFYFVNTTILGKLLSSGSLDDDKFALYFGLVTKCVSICKSASDKTLKPEYKSFCTTALDKANKQMMKRGQKNKYKSKKKNVFLRLLEDVNTKAELVSSAMKIYHNTPRKGTVEHILYELMLLGEKEVSDEFSQEDFEREFERLRDKLGKLLTKLTGRVINLSNGLSVEHVLFVMMNYATPKTKRWKDSEWTYDTMKPTEGCIGFWRQSVITCLERGVGIEKTDEHMSSCISTQDRLFWVCNTNKSDYVDEIDDVCEDADILEDTMHLIPIILLALKVKYSRMNGHMPSILATGSPVRDNLFEIEDTLITKQAIFAGCVPHSEMFMRKDRFLHAYPEIAVHHKYSQRLAVFYPQRFSTTSECTFTEDWTGLGNLSPEEMEQFQEEHRQLMKEISSRGGMMTARLSQLASALHDVDWKIENLSPVMQLRLLQCLEHKNRHKKKNKFDEDDFIEFLDKLHKSRVRGRKKGGKTTGEMQTLYKRLHKVGWEPDSTLELRFTFDLIHVGYNNRHKDEMDEDEFIEYLKRLRENTGQLGGSVESEAKSKSNGWNTLYVKKSEEEKPLIEPLINIIEPVIADIKFTKSNTLGGANDKLLEESLLAALRKFDKETPTGVKSLLWCSQNHQEYRKGINEDKRGTITGKGGKYIKFEYFKDQQFVVICDSTKSRAHIEMQVIIRALLNAKIPHHQKKENEAKIKGHMLDLLRTVVTRGSKKKTQGRRMWTLEEDAQVLAVGSRGGQVAIGDWSLEQAVERWDTLRRKANEKKRKASEELNKSKKKQK